MKGDIRWKNEGRHQVGKSGGRMKGDIRWENEGRHQVGK